MHIDHKSKLIFIHNPKTAGRSIVSMLGLSDSDSFRFAHVYPSIVKDRFFQDDWSKFFSFAFVRNPWERYISLYYFQRSAKYALLQPNSHSSALAGRFELNDWIEYNSQARVKSNWFGIPQASWTLGVSEVFRFERFEEAIKSLRLRFDVKSKIDFQNEGQYEKVKPSITLNEKSKKVISEIDHEVIRKYGYKCG